MTQCRSGLFVLFCVIKMKKKVNLQTSYLRLSGCERRVEFPASAALRSRSTQPLLQQEGLLQMCPPQLLQLPGALLHPLRRHARHREGRRDGRCRLPVLRPPHPDVSAVCRHHSGTRNLFFLDNLNFCVVRIQRITCVFSLCV